MRFPMPISVSSAMANGVGRLTSRLRPRHGRRYLPIAVGLVLLSLGANGLGSGVIALPSPVQDNLRAALTVVVPHLARTAPILESTAPLRAAQSSPAAPSKRWGAAMTYDAAPRAGYLLLFSGSGGGIDQGNVAYGDTWSYQSGNWQDLSPNTCVPTNCPLERTHAAMSYYNRSGQQYVVLVGGQSGGSNPTLLDDTWVFENGSWINVTPLHLNATNSPPPFHSASMAWDPIDGIALLYGGCTSPGCNNNTAVSNQTWAFEGLNSTQGNGKVVQQAQWVELETAVHPPGLYGAGLTFDAESRSLILFGGVAVPTDHLLYTNQTWSYSVESGWVNLTLPPSEQTPANTPPTRVWMGLTYDPTYNYILLFSGQKNQSKLANPTLNDTWTFARGSWTNISASLEPNVPHARFSCAMAYDPATQSVVVFGGLSGTLVGSPVLDDLWTFSGTPGAWTEVGGAPPTNAPGLPGLTTWEYDLIIAAPFVALAVVIVLLRRRKKPAPSPSSARAGSGMEDPRPTPSDLGPPA